MPDRTSLILFCYPVSFYISGFVPRYHLLPDLYLRTLLLGSSLSILLLQISGELDQRTHSANPRNRGRVKGQIGSPLFQSVFLLPLVC